jgi:hypothetical protein
LNALLINDIHIGVNRSAGTTLESRRGLKQYLNHALRDLIFRHTDKELIINGDLFDAFDVDIQDILWTYYTFSDWIFESRRTIYMGKGNHDISKDDSKMSAFSFLAMLLTKAYPDNIVVIEGGLQKLSEHTDFIWMIPHCVNQEQFEQELTKVLDIEVPGYLLLHANVDNHYADQADHSLNVSDEWIRKLIDKKWTLVFGHEHHHKRLYDGEVIVTGNQFPSSVYDCLSTQGQKDGLKYAHIFSQTKRPDGTIDVCLDKVSTWDAIGNFVEIPWQFLNDPHTYKHAPFYRVTGTATAEQAPDVVATISKFRQNSKAYVVSNAVEIQGIKGMDDLTTLTVEKLQKVDILAALKQHLDLDEIKAVDELLRNRI